MTSVPVATASKQQLSAGYIFPFPGSGMLQKSAIGHRHIATRYFDAVASPIIRTHLYYSKNLPIFARIIARMAESVDALVSNTSGAIHPGSIPGPGTDND